MMNHVSGKNGKSEYRKAKNSKVKSVSLRKRRIFSTLMTILLAILLIFSLCELAGWRFLKNPIASVVKSRLHGELNFGDHFSLHLIPELSFRCDSIQLDTLSDQPTEQSSPTRILPAKLLHVTRLSVEVPYSTLWQLAFSADKNPVYIKNLDVDTLEIWLKRKVDGSSNWASSSAPPEPSDKPFMLPRFGQLAMKKGDISIDDEIAHLKGDFHLGIKEPNPANGHKELWATGNGSYEGRPFNLLASSTGALSMLTGAAPSSNNPADSDRPAKTDMSLKIDMPFKIDVKAGESEVSFDGVMTDAIKAGGLRGQVMVKGNSMASVGDAVGVTLPTTSPFKLTGKLSKEAVVWSLQQATLDVGRSHLSGDFVYDKRPQVPLLTGELRGAPFVLADLAPAFGAPAAGAPNPSPPPDKVLPQRDFDIPSLLIMNAGVDLNFQQVNLGKIFERPLEPLRARLELQNGALAVKNMLARTADGEIRGTISLKVESLNAQPQNANAGKQAVWHADLKMADILLEKWLSPTNKYADDSSKKEAPEEKYISGKLNGNLQFDATGNSTASMLGSLSGNLKTWISEGKISHLIIEALGLDIAESLGVIVTGDTPLALRCAVVDMHAEKGVLRPQVALFDTSDSTVVANGDISLKDETLDLKLMVFPRDRSILSLRAPLWATGNFASPTVRPAGLPLGRKVTSAALLSLLNPFAALIPMIDVGQPEKAGGCQQAYDAVQKSMSGKK